MKIKVTTVSLILVNFIFQQKSIGMDGPLIDSEGFPRADIDIYSVRHARQKIICKCVN